MKTKTHTIKKLSYLVIAAMILSSLMLFNSSCKKDPIGTCEVKTSGSDGYSVQYYCREEWQKSLCESNGGGEMVFYENSSCSELGYSYASDVFSNHYNASPNNPTTPGANGNWAGSTGGGGGIGSYDYTFTCAGTGFEYTVPIPEDGCETANEYYARTFTCNDVANMYDACRDYFGCNGQTDISFCDVYR